MKSLSERWRKIFIRRLFILIFSSLAILGTASSCSTPSFFNQNQNSTTFGILKKDPSVRAEGFVRANSVTNLDGSIDGQGLSQLSVLKLIRLDEQKLFALTKEKGLFRTTDSAVSWQRVYVFPVGSSNENPEQRQAEIQRQVLANDSIEISDFAVDPTLTSIIYVAIEEEGVGKIYQSLDNGENFREIYSEIDEDIKVRFITVDPVNNLNIFAVLEEGALLRTTDGGITWAKVRSFRDTPVQIGFVPEFDQLFFILLEKEGLATSTDLGETWNLRELTKEASEIGERQPRDQLDILPRETETFGSYEKIVPVTAGLTINSQRGVNNNSENDNPWLLVADRQMWYSQDDGQNFRKLVLPIQSEQADIYDITPDPVSGLDRIFASVDNRLFITRNQGESWNTQDNINLNDEIGNIGQILVEPNNPEIIYLTLLDPRAVRDSGLIIV